MKIYIVHFWDDGTYTAFSSENKMREFIQTYCNEYEEESNMAFDFDEATIIETEIDPTYPEVINTECNLYRYI